MLGSMEKRCFAAMLLGTFISLAGYAYAEQPYTRIAEMMCDNVKVKVTTECYQDDPPDMPLCSKQYFEFADRNTGESIVKPASGITSDDYYLASRLQCMRGKTQSYLMVMYYNGGNCDKCEWAEIRDLTGKKVATDWPKTKKSMKQFDNAWDRFGLGNPQPGGLVPGSQFMSIPRHRTDK